MFIYIIPKECVHLYEKKGNVPNDDGMSSRLPNN